MKTNASKLNLLINIAAEFNSNNMPTPVATMTEKIKLNSSKEIAKKLFKTN